jgi:hypothetical protein
MQARRGLMGCLLLSMVVPTLLFSQAPTCFSCCPISDDHTVTLASPDCCGNDCAPRMNEGGGRSCTLTQRASSADPVVSVVLSFSARPVLETSQPQSVPFFAPSSPSPPIITSLRL